MNSNKYIAVVGSRQLPAIYKIKIKQIAKALLDKGYNIASGGAMGADNHALESLLELGAVSRGVIFSPWQTLDQFPWSAKKAVSKFTSLGGRIIWGNVQPFAQYKTVADGLLARNVRLAANVSGLVAFVSTGSRGTIHTIREAIQRNVPVIVFICDSLGHLPNIKDGRWQLLNLGGCWENGFKFIPQQARQRPVVAPARQQAAATIT